MEVKLLNVKDKALFFFEQRVLFSQHLEAAYYLFCAVSVVTDVAEGDPDADCRSLAVQSLVLLDKNLKKQLQDPQALTLDT